MRQRLALLSKLTAPISCILTLMGLGIAPAYAVSSGSTEQEKTVLFTTQVNSQTATPEGGFVVLEETTYLAEFVSQNAYPRLMAGQSYKFVLTVKNIGTATWENDVVHLGTDRPRDRIPSFIREDIPGKNPSGWIKDNRIIMQEDSVAPGENATFEFWYTVPQTLPDGVYREYFNLVADGITWLNDLGIFWEVTVDNLPHARFVDQNAYPPTLKAGDSYEFWVRFENTGLLPWRDDGPTPVHLGTDRSMDRVPGFLREGPPSTISGWTNGNGNRVELERDPATGALIGDENVNNQIDPGEIARFRFWYTVPATMESGRYREYMRPVMDNRDWGWMEDYGVFWEIVVDNIAPRPATVNIRPTVNRLNITWSASAEATSYKVRYRPVGGDVFTILDFPGSVTVANLVVAGGQDFEVGVASVDAEGVSPFTESRVHVESPAEAQVRVEREKAVAAERERLEEERRRAEEEPIVTGPPGEAEPTRDFRQFWLTLIIILGAAGLATAGYYGYEWWAEVRRRPAPPRRPTPPKREEPPKPPASPTRW